MCSARIHTYRNMYDLTLIGSLGSYIGETSGDYQIGFQHNRSTDEIFCIHQMLKKKWDYNETVHQLLIDFKKAYDSVRRELLCNIRIAFGVPMKLG
jgi:hypothetical protein